MKLIKKITSLFLVITLLLSMTIPASAASFFTVHEVYGAAGRVYLTNHDDVPVRAEPHNGGAILDYLPNAYPVEAIGMFRTWKGTLWLRIVNESYESPEAWIFMGNLELHSCTFVAIEEYGVEFCNKCGHIRAICLDTNLVDTDALHIILAGASLIPLIGNGFDLLDGMLSICEGDYGSAVLSIASAVPVFGSIGNALKTTDTTLEIFATTENVVTMTKVGANAVEVAVKPSSKVLAKNMDLRYLETFNDRFYNYKDYILPNRAMAAHHIVAGSASNTDARIARGLLNYLGIGINSAENGIYLASKADIIINGTLHTTLHTSEYYEYVTRTLLNAFHNAKYPSYASPEVIKLAQRSAVVDALDNIAMDLMS